MSNPASPLPPRLIRVAVAGSVILMIAAGGLFYYASKSASSKRAANSEGEITVTIHPKSCEPNSLTVPAGKTRFKIVNASDRAVEWEILDGVLVVEERENIVPGLSSIINANLQPGDYAITCGLLSNPRGTLHVTATAESDAQAKAKPSLVNFVGPLSEYRVYLSMQGSALIKAVDALNAAIALGDVDQAQALYVEARTVYQHIAPAAQRMAELNNAIEARADYYEKREQDPGFSGFHRLEYGLFAKNSIDGLAPVGQKLLADVTRLKQELLAQQLPPEQLITIISRNIRSLAETRTSGEEERYSHSDLNGFAANLEGTRKVVDLLRPLLSKSGPQVLASIDTAANDLDVELNGFKDQDAFISYDKVDASQRKQIADRAKALADALDGISPALGLTGQ
jgi:iron uptake system EfeUOB component EfeO/EfeM